VGHTVDQGVVPPEDRLPVRYALCRFDERGGPPRIQFAERTGAETISGHFDKRRPALEPHELLARWEGPWNKERQDPSPGAFGDPRTRRLDHALELAIHRD
jgi:hypothetical protein